MADSFTANLNLCAPQVGSSFDSWGTKLNSDLDLLDAVFLATGVGTSVGLHIGTDKVLNVEGHMQISAFNDISKTAVLDSQQISTGTTRVFQFPDADGILALKDRVSPTGTVLTGYYGGTAPPGFVFLFGRSIGDAASGATERAHADTVNLFTLFWLLGFTPTGGRGASAALDFAAHKAMQLPDHRGRVMAAIDFASNVLTPAGPSTQRAAALGGATQTFAVSVGGSGTFGGTISGTAFTSGLGTTGITTGAFNAAGNNWPVAVQDHQHAVSGNAGVSGSCSVGVSLTSTGATDTRSIAQPTIMVDTVIAL